MNILVTNFNGYWEIGDREAKYPIGMIHANLSQPQSKMEAVFIKVAKASTQVQRGWRGVVHSIRKTSDETCFKVTLSQRISQAELREYEGYKPGWYDKPSVQSPVENRSDAQLLPGFVNELETTPDHARFEILVYILLRLLGIHRVFKFPQAEQAGKGDGFFKFGNLAVIYDCTLRSNFETYKRQQIDNYCNQLHQGLVELRPDVQEWVKVRDKQVWIITRGKSRIVKKVGDRGTVIVT